VDTSQSFYGIVPCVAILSSVVRMASAGFSAIILHKKNALSFSGSHQTK